MPSFYTAWLSSLAFTIMQGLLLNNVHVFCAWGYFTVKYECASKVYLTWDIGIASAIKEN